jgi:hypothetical protein
MTEHSVAPPGASTHNDNGNLLYGMEYENTGTIDKNHDGDAACAVCAPPTKGHIYTEWGRYGSCSTTGHVKVYEGLIMSSHYNEYKSESVCVDIERAVHAGSSTSNDDGGRLYTTEMEEGSSHESWYPHNIELGCTICAAPSNKAVYTRWGSRSCPTGSTKMYEGFIAGSHHSHHGGGYNYLCMTEHSAAPPGANTHDNNGELLYGVEYHNTGSVDKNHGHDAACAVCQHDAAPYTFTQWGRYGSCTNGFEKVYEGLIMSDWYTHYKTESICVDMERAAHAGSSSGTQSQGILYTSEMEGGSAHEEWYPHDIELGCTVCAPVNDGKITSDMCVSGFHFDSTMGDCVSEAEIWSI